MAKRPQPENYSVEEVDEMELNAKNRLQELFASLGWIAGCVQYDSHRDSSGAWESEATFRSNVIGSGKRSRTRRHENAKGK